MDAFAPEKFARVLQGVQAGGLSWTEAEIQATGADHGLLGWAILTYWGLPASLTEVVRWHSEPWRAGEQADRAAAVFIADVVARLLGYFPFGPEVQESSYLASLKMLPRLAGGGLAVEPGLLDRLGEKVQAMAVDFDPTGF